MVVEWLGRIAVSRGKLLCFVVVFSRTQKQTPRLREGIKEFIEHLQKVVEEEPEVRAAGSACVEAGTHSGADGGLV